MPCRPRLQLCGVPLHVVQRGNNRSPCFFAEADYLFCRHWLRLLAAKHRCAIHAYALMRSTMSTCCSSPRGRRGHRP